MADVVVVGGGVIGLAVATAAAERRLSVVLLTADRPGAAARAAAGLLVPHYSGEEGSSGVERFMAAGRDLYPIYIPWVEERSGQLIPFDASGAIRLAASSADYEALLRAAPADARPLPADAVAQLEPELAPATGALLYPRDGAVDNVRLTDALASIAARHPSVRTVHEAAAAVEVRRASGIVIGASGTRVEGRHVVLAAGAWSAQLRGLPRRIPVRPLRGQICVLRGAPIRHVVLGTDAYMVARAGDRTLIGSTMEDVGFDVGTTTEAIEGLRAAAVAICPTLRDAPVIDAWSGLRPATPDLLPILGPDPEYPVLLYACGHSRNGILLAPITAAVTCATVLGETPACELAPFAIDRFGLSATRSNRSLPD